ncbi:hypothetical protein OG196_31740 [Kitasatospora purpeofusca]|uniref:hypothetical protein n=1 Tax=Kitasatospora purpeofusca TaxID=67352 RepID=UPI002E13C098|nr:hypothetical protein OG196_31740 [Kitasatospora purpeofusca]
MAARKPAPRSTAAQGPQAPASAGTSPPSPAVPGTEVSSAAPLEPAAAPLPPPTAPPPHPEAPVTPGITQHQPLLSDGVTLVNADGDELPHDLDALFDLTHPDWTVVYPKVRIYQRRSYKGSGRTATQLLYTPAQSIPRAEFDQLRQTLGWE